MQSVQTVLAFLVVLGVLIFVHELGHFLAAKWAGMYVHRFSIGMGPTIPWLTRRIGETEYALSWLPLGGYVRVATGEDGTGSDALEGRAEDEPDVPADRLYENKPVWKRVVFVLGGVVFNLVFAWMVYTGLALKNGRTVDPELRVGDVATTLPAGAEALREVRPGDRLAAVNGVPVESWTAFSERFVGAAGDSVVIGLADRRAVVVRVHQDALGDRLAALQALEPYRAPVIGQLLAGRPAERAGLVVGDTVRAINGTAVSQWGDLVAAIEGSAGTPTRLAIRRGADSLELSVVPSVETVRDSAGRSRTVGRIGVGPAIPVRSEPLSAGGAMAAGGQAVVDGVVQIWRTIKGMLTARISSRELGGPILIGQLAGQSARLGIDALLGLMALLSVNLAVFNLLPVPVLDGGQLVFLLIEGVIRRPVPLVIREWGMRLGVAAVLLLMVLAFSNDFRRLLGL